MPTHGTHCDFCGQHRQAEADLREAMAMTDLLLRVIEPDSKQLWAEGSEVNRARALLARLVERYPT